MQQSRVVGVFAVSQALDGEIRISVVRRLFPSRTLGSRSAQESNKSDVRKLIVGVRERERTEEKAERNTKKKGKCFVREILPYQRLSSSIPWE